MMTSSQVRQAVVVAIMMVGLAACGAEQIAAVDAADRTSSEQPPDQGERDGVDTDVPALWSGEDEVVCTSHGVFEVALAEHSAEAARQLLGSPGFASSLDELVRTVLARGTALGRPPLEPRYLHDFENALPPGSDYEKQAASERDDASYTDEALATDASLRESLILESEEPDQALTTVMVDIREAAAQASAQRELLEAWADGTIEVTEGEGFVVLTDGWSTMRVEHAHDVYALSEFAHQVDCYQSQSAP